MGSVQYYAAMLATRQPVIHAAQTSLTRLWAHNHCRICGAGGVQQLVIPIEKSNYFASTPLRDVTISEHGNWRHQHWGALFSSYGKSPFFDYIADDLERIVRGNQRFLLDLNMQLHQLIVDFLDLPISCNATNTLPDHATGKMQLCFLTNNDITGGNSGSPMFNGKGELIGLAFDGNWDSLASDILFDRQLARCIGVDIRYVLYMMDKWGNTERLIKEINAK